VDKGPPVPYAAARPSWGPSDERRQGSEDPRHCVSGFRPVCLYRIVYAALSENFVNSGKYSTMLALRRQLQLISVLTATPGIVWYGSTAAGLRCYRQPAPMRSIAAAHSVFAQPAASGQERKWQTPASQGSPLASASLPLRTLHGIDRISSGKCIAGKGLAR
jgi:hypothetical protein